MPKTKASSGVAYQIKISLRGSKPPIWRRVVIPADLTLAALHEVIQTAMGWYDCHLHAFEVDGEEFAGKGPDAYVDTDNGGLDDADYRLSDVARHEKDTLDYVYDFGDDWKHTITVEKIIPAGDNRQAWNWTCLTGKGACPPEDCGGIHGYYQLLGALQDPKHPEHKEMKEWYGEMNPEKFDPEAVTKRLEALKKRI